MCRNPHAFVNRHTTFYTSTITDRAAFAFMRFEGWNVFRINTGMHQNIGLDINGNLTVHANLSKHRIKEFLKTLNPEELIEGGRRILNSRIQVYGYKGIDFLTEEQKNKLMEKFIQKNWDSVLCNLGNGTINVNDAIAELFSKSELIGEEINTDYMKAYVDGTDRVHVSIAPPKIHKVHLKIETVNRVGMIRDISDVIAQNGVNILKITTMILDEGSRSELAFSLEIRNINQYENLVYAIHEVPGVLKVNRVQSDESAQINSDDFHKELSQ